MTLSITFHIWLVLAGESKWQREREPAAPARLAFYHHTTIVFKYKFLAKHQTQPGAAFISRSPCAIKNIAVNFFYFVRVDSPARILYIYLGAIGRFVSANNYATFFRGELNCVG